MCGVRLSACGHVSKCCNGLTSLALSRQIEFDECIGREATVEPRVAWPELRLSGQVAKSPV
jgi:hypothetical protein